MSASSLSLFLGIVSLLIFATLIVRSAHDFQGIEEQREDEARQLATGDLADSAIPPDHEFWI